ncbi:MAG: hypothetical protein KF716_19250 [Anaerolineae bacterium]|nr:hypothetical protein [Anaerolineae bacterium]
MNVLPQPDGTLLVNDLSPETLYDMGNPRLYAQADAQGRIVTAFVPEGLPLQTMRGVRYLELDERISVDSRSVEDVARSLAEQFKGTDSEGTGNTQKKPWQAVEARSITFEAAQAIGRLWTLTGRGSDLAVSVTTFVDDSNPAAFQRIEISNQGTTTRVFALDVAVSLDFAFTYIGSRSVNSGRVRAKLQFEANFGATLRPWLMVMDKTLHVLSYALPVAPGETAEFCLVTAAGDEAVLDRLLRHWQQSYEAANAYNRRLMELANNDDPLLQSLIVAGLNAGLSAYKKLDSGAAGFCAGVSYAYPPRVYFRDSYWTAQAALIAQPDMVRDNLLWLARGISADGSCPSAVWDPGLFAPTEAESPTTLKWLNDHYDSPSFFVMLLHDYIVATGERDLLKVTVNGSTLWQYAAACMRYLAARDEDGDALFEKPRTANDWADNVRRGGLVTYDLALYYRGLQCAAWMGTEIGDPTAAWFGAQAVRVLEAINAKLWDEERGYYRNYQNATFTETNLSIDTLLTVLYGVSDDAQTERVLNAARNMLQTRHNHEQSHGDWGVMCCYPFYHEPADLFSISAEPYRYHNGADWPYWDGVYGLILMQQDDPDWRYVLTRAWEMALAHGWLTPFEYWSPPHPVGGLLQGWSAMPAVALLSKQHVTWQNQVPGKLS